ncbi:MAG: hypothetical protein ACK5Q5_08735 [Planctomycetaceae bacterium]
MNSATNNRPQPSRFQAVWLLCATVCALCLHTSIAIAGPLRAGAAASNITPPLGELIVGNWKPMPATNIHDELHARCLVLNDGETSLVIVLCDNVGIPREVFDKAKEYIAAECQIPSSNVLCAATHTHSATTARGENKVVPVDDFSSYQSFLSRRIADGVRRAVTNLEPAAIAFGAVDEPSEIFNRRWYVTDPNLLQNPFGGVDKVRMNPPAGNAALVRPAGPIDPQISFISVQSIEGRPISLLANYSLHYVGGVKGAEVSADYFGCFANTIAELLNADKQSPPFVGILSNGTSGDCNNINFAKPAPRKPPYEKMQRVADLVAQRVYETHSSLQFHKEVSLAAATAELTLAVRKPTPDMLARFDELETAGWPAEKAKHHEETYATRIRRLAESPDTVTIPLQTFRIGDIGIAAIPFETFAETGLEIKEKGPIKHTFTIELANGSYGYLPTPPQHELGGYETWLGTNNVEKEASVKIVDTLMKLFEQVK